MAVELLPLVPPTATLVAPPRPRPPPAVLTSTSSSDDRRNFSKVSSLLFRGPFGFRRKGLENLDKHLEEEDAEDAVEAVEPASTSEAWSRLDPLSLPKSRAWNWEKVYYESPAACMLWALAVLKIRIYIRYRRKVLRCSGLLSEFAFCIKLQKPFRSTEEEDALCKISSFARATRGAPKWTLRIFAKWARSETPVPNEAG